ncbi:MAG: hypothetical protein Greene041662_800 [Candidatus Peregrinibacteria bacterium Greene0416_62]|nr:MAG: hypothetical protein Greene041662_800 [Candidatus Peregrinibacteria bacterium Greene0416_62]
MTLSDLEFELPGPHEAHILGFGGTLTCADVGKLRKPIRGRIKEIVDRGVPQATLDKYQTIGVTESELFGDSNQLRANPDLMQMVHETRTHLQELGRNMIIVMGTDQAAAAAHVFAEGISPEELGDRSIIVVVSQTHIPDTELSIVSDEKIVASEPARVLNDALKLSMRKEIRRRIVVLAGPSLYPARGLRKANTKKDDPFECRFDTAATLQEKGWQLYDPSRTKAGAPRGDGKEFTLEMGVEVKELGITADYKNLWRDIKNSIPSWWRRFFLHQVSHYQGIVLSAPGEGSVRENSRDLQYLVQAANIAAKHNIPMMLVGDPQQSEHPLIGDPDSHYAGSMPIIQKRLFGTSQKRGQALMGGGKKTATEARLLISAARAKGVDIQKHIDAYDNFLSQKD